MEECVKCGGIKYPSNISIVTIKSGRMTYEGTRTGCKHKWKTNEKPTNR